MDQDVFNTDRPLAVFDRLPDARKRVGRGGRVAGCVASLPQRRPVDHPFPKAFATTIVTRLCLDRLKSAQATRQEYIGPWLPEPVLTSEVEGPDTMLQRAESVTLAFLVLLEKLSPEERAVFLLKEVFDYEHSEIAEMLGTTAENSRQLLHRAKARLAEGRPRLTGTAQSRRAVAERFARRVLGGDGSELTALLAEEVGMWSDGGGKASAARRPLLGRDQVLEFPDRPASHRATCRDAADVSLEDRRRQFRARAGRACRATARVDIRLLDRERCDCGNPRHSQPRQARAYRSAAHEAALIAMPLSQRRPAKRPNRTENSHVPSGLSHA